VDEVESLSFFTFLFAWGPTISVSIGTAAKVVGDTWHH
jgi:hypothetical protein